MEKELFDLLMQEEENKEKQKYDIYKVPMKTITWYVNCWSKNVLPDAKRKLLYSYDIESGKYFAIDNTTDNCYMKDFKNEIECLKWLGADIK